MKNKEKCYICILRQIYQRDSYTRSKEWSDKEKIVIAFDYFTHKLFWMMIKQKQAIK